MEITANNFIIYISSLTLSLSYCYYISSNLPKGIYRFISLIPILYLFTILPLRFSSIFTIAITFSFTTWLTNFKLIRFAFDLDHSPFHPSYSLLKFITFTSLPINSNTTHPKSSNTRPKPLLLLLLFKSGLQVIIFSLLVHIVFNYKHFLKPDHNMVMVIYCGLLFLIIDIVADVANTLMFILTGLELEPSSNQPYLATSLQDFWGRWNLMVTNTLRHTVYKPVKSTLSDYKWAPLVGVFVSFVVSGLMHELFVYELSRVEPTWEMTWFFVIHGVCVVVEMVVKRWWLAGGRLRLPEFVSRVLTVGFVVVTGMWLFFPPLIRSRLDVRIFQEYTSVIGFIKANFLRFNIL